VIVGERALKMKRRRHTPEQVIRKLREADRLLAEGKSIAEVARALEVSENTYHRWRNQFGGMKAVDAKRLRELERENQRLKRIVADQVLENEALKEISKGNWGARPAGVRRSRCFATALASASAGRAGSSGSTDQLSATVRADDDAALRSALREIAGQRPRWGYRCVHHRLGELGWSVNRKRVQRLWREEGLRVPARARKRRRVGECTAPEGRLRAERPDHVWAFDCQLDQTADGRVLKLLNVVDEFTREVLVMHVARSITADQTVAVLEQIAATRGRVPQHLLCDNGPEMTARADRLVPPDGRDDALHRPRHAVAERLRGVLPLPRARRAAQRRAVLLPGRSPRDHRRLARGLQHPPPTLRAGHATPDRVRCGLGQARSSTPTGRMTPRP
jgi:putative transposase